MKKGKKKKGGGKKTMERGRIEPSSRISIGKLLLKSPMRYLSPTGTLQLHCEQFWTFIVYANAHAQCDVQHTHTQAELYRDILVETTKNTTVKCSCSYQGRIREDPLVEDCSVNSHKPAKSHSLGV